MNGSNARASNGDAIVCVIIEAVRKIQTHSARLAVSEPYQWPLSAFLPGVLEQFDLPACYRALGAKKLRQIEPWGAKAGA